MAPKIETNTFTTTAGPVDPVQTKTDLTTAIAWCQAGLSHNLAKVVIDPTTVAAMQRLLATSQELINDPVRWPNLVDLVNGLGQTP